MKFTPFNHKFIRAITTWKAQNPWTENKLALQTHTKPISRTSINQWRQMKHRISVPNSNSLSKITIVTLITQRISFWKKLTFKTIKMSSFTKCRHQRGLKTLKDDQMESESELMVWKGVWLKRGWRFRWIFTIYRKVTFSWWEWRRNWEYLLNEKLNEIHVMNSVKNFPIEPD